ncbi:hypothetical protein [Vibrio parahaemolyticus]|uniref:hypothetical protein n=1 Tax=Vibrio parahaemolyticus TaxID=670 RepID=UPI00084A9696|nr:hypothetical protein [Vibrio parahaemolyticus]ODY78772.1 hypothetical protein BBM31_20560 [Vibrio parahaemolyticus]
MKHKQRELLAYIELESGTVLIDIVKLTRNGRSYYFQGKRWLRNQYGLGCDDCTSESGDKLNISILNRNMLLSGLKARCCVYLKGQKNGMNFGYQMDADSGAVSSAQ